MDRDPTDEAQEAWEARCEAEAAKHAADGRYKEAKKVADQLRRERGLNHFVDMFRAALRGDG